MARGNHETRFQIAAVQFLNAAMPRGAVLWHVPNGGQMTETARMMLSAMGERPGASDLMMFWDGRLFCMECKVKRNPYYGIKHTSYQSKEQKEFQRAIEAQGGVYAVVRSTDDIRDFLLAEGVPLRVTETGYKPVEGRLGQRGREV